MRFLIVLNEEALPKLYGTEEEARAEAERLAEAFEAEHGSKADWFVAEVEGVQ